MRSFNQFFLLGMIMCCALQIKAQTVEEITSVVTRNTKPSSSSLVINNGKLTLEGSWTLDYSTDGNWFGQAIDHTPSEGATVSGDSPITITFPEAIDMSTVNNGLTVKNEYGVDISGTWTQSEETLTFHPASILMGATIFVNIKTQLQGESGIYSSVDFTWSFHTNNFITRWKFPSASGTKTVHLPLLSTGTYDFYIDWGDGTSDVISSWDQAETSHTYANFDQDYQVQIHGTIKGWSFHEDTRSADYLYDVINWGTLQPDNTWGHFYNCRNMIITAQDELDLSQTNSLHRSFAGCESITQIPGISNWDVSGITSMNFTFQDATNFNSDLNGWNVSNVVSFHSMFEDATNFNGAIDLWQPSSATSMRSMFESAHNFDQDLDGWGPHLNAVTNMTSMFASAASFNGNVSSWITTSVTDISYMFNNADAFNGDLSSWEVANVQGMEYMFSGADNFNSDLSTWNVANCTDFRGMFRYTNSFDHSLGSWNISSATNLLSMFDYAYGLSPSSYDETLIGWSNQSATPHNLSLGANSVKYCSAQTARDKLINDFSWTITDGGVTNSSPIPDVANLPDIVSTTSVTSLTAPTATDPCVGSITGTTNISLPINTCRQITWIYDNGKGSVVSQTQNVVIDVPANNFITTWNTSSVTIPIGESGNESYSIDWGDGTTEFVTINNPSHNYTSTGNYTVSVCGKIDYFRSDLISSVAADNLISVDQWGNTQWTSMYRMFFDADNVQINATDDPDLSNVTNMSSMFYGSDNMNSDISDWDVSNVLYMSSIFENTSSFNQDLSNWNVIKLQSGHRMFKNATAFNQPLNWGTKTTEMKNTIEMFFGAPVDQDFGNWDITGITSMEKMLRNSNMSQTNYDATLAGWASQTVNYGVDFDAFPIQYCNQTSRDVLTVTNGWTIFDGGLSSSCSSGARSVINQEEEEATTAAEAIQGMTIYPNPASDHFTLELADFEETWVTISNLSGKALSVPMELVKPRTEFDLTGITDRILFLHIKQPNGERTLRILRQD